MSEKKGCEKMSQKHQKSQARSISVNAIAEKQLLIWEYVEFAAIAVFFFLVFHQSDLLHTEGRFPHSLYAFAAPAFFSSLTRLSS